jgi:hypothetical protein
MKWLIVPLLWALAATLAVAVLWRLYRGKNIVLRGKWSPRVVRMVAIILVVMGVGVENSPSAPVTPPADKNKTDAKSDELPAAVTTTTIRQWFGVQMPLRTENRWLQFKQDLTLAVQSPGSSNLPALKNSALGVVTPEKVAALFVNDIDALESKKELPRLDGKEFLAIYDAMESGGYYDHWLNAYLWRRTANARFADDRQQAEVYARMYRHARLTDALIRAHGEVKPYTIGARAWMSKMGPGPAEHKLEDKGLADMLEATRKNYAALDGGTWKRDGIAVLTVAKDSPAPVLLRAGRRQPLPSGETIRFGRLDLIETPDGDKPVSLEHAWLGPVTLPAGRTVSVWQLSSLVSDEGQKKIDKTVRAALDGDEDAADRLELALPLAHAAIRDAVAGSPKAKLAPRLRMMLALFDDAVMPVLTPLKSSETPYGPGFGGPGGAGGPGVPPGGER